MNLNLVRSIYGRSSIKIAHLVRCDLLINKTSLKAGNIYGKFCIKFPQDKMTGEQGNHKLRLKNVYERENPIL